MVSAWGDACGNNARGRIYGNGGSHRRADARANIERIAQAATDVLRAKPMAGLAEIADAAGVSRATVYRHFSSLEQLRGVAGLHPVASNQTVQGRQLVRRVAIFLGR